MRRTGSIARSSGRQHAHAPRGRPRGKATRAYACGTPVADPVDAGSTHDGVTASISSTQRGADGAPQVRYTLTATRTVHVVDQAPG
jgi:hypothetical protein